jgi:hypothetical protein
MAQTRIFRPVARPMGEDGQPRTEPERVIETRGLWGAGTGELLSFYTSSLQSTSSREYYYEVWSSASLDCEDAQVFSVTYGHYAGSGSLSQGGEAGDTPTRAIYSQYKLICLDPGETQFRLGDTNATVVNDFYAINFNRNKVGDKLDPGNFELCIAELSGSGKVNSAHTGSAVQVSGSNPTIIRLIDDSADQSDSLGYNGIPSPVRHLVSGSLTDGIHNPSNPHYYGLVYADLGTIIISADKLNLSASFNTVTGSNINGDNSYKLFTSISGSATKEFGFIARAVDVKQQDFYFVRIGNNEYNYSTNPTYVSGSNTGFLSNPRFSTEPVTYITSIGLYDRPGGDLLAVAKLSKPLQKSFNSELSITVKLEY